MKGFDNKFRDVPTYILGITHEIWEGRGVVSALKRYYADDVVVRAANQIFTNNDRVAAATLQTLHEFPDRKLIGEDVVWRDDGEDGYLTSHRLLSIKRHTGSGAYGRATGRQVRSRIIAECWIRRNQVVEEWLVRDQAAFAKGLGVSVEALARRQAKQDLKIAGRIAYFTPAEDVPSRLAPVIAEGGDAGIYADGWREIWHEKRPSAVASLYHKGASIEIPGGHAVNGDVELDQFVIAYLASFPDADFRIEQLMVNENEKHAVRLAMRWSIAATHSGWGRFGIPTGADVYIMGLTHAHMVNGRVTMEWIQIDEVAIWKQIIAHQHARGDDIPGSVDN